MIHILNWLKPRWRFLIVLLTPLVFLPIPLIGKSSQARCGYIVIILTIYWVFEAIPLPVTSLLPLALFPMAGILTAERVAPHYFKDIITLFFGSMALAYAVESVNLHRRIALLVLSFVGTSSKWSMAGLMGVTGFLSMWINNSAAASIMLPVALAIADELEKHSKGCQEKKNRAKEAAAAANEVIDLNHKDFVNERPIEAPPLDQLHIDETKLPVSAATKKRFRLPWKNGNLHKPTESTEQQYEQIRKGFLLAVAYSATIGGLSSLVGTAPNIFVKGFADRLFQFRIDPETRAAQADLKAMLIKQYNDLGKPNWSELSVAIVFVCMIILWVTKDFSGTPGWEIIFEENYISDGTVAILCGVLPLILPNANPLKKDWKYEPIIGWNGLAKHMPWGALILLGAGLTVASAFQASKLSDSVAHALRFLAGIPRAAVILLIIIISGLFTEVTSNLSTASIFFPVLDSVARSSGMHPALLILPCTLAVSLAFMLPIATPPNAIVFASGSIRVVDMVKTGIVMNIIGFLVIFFAATTWMPKIYGLNDRATELFFSVNTTLSVSGSYNGTD
ncbi:unnamed protein product [Rotaria socialis]|uniref:Uncharacterized protein n=1 Tax=Rotaria socialis TaxID=392032 RepID=A0A817L6B1_9BILA|nr:unnamed protein product [Rotaria socialis]CAF3379104.1 unnamed protein product [Rotaria socialis]CAF3432527.1 unnamed protein product [Rotaria socialis]CAF3723796.1 unnamed protein product [Rotaria socialis]CAF4180585.1 unnamed protein product [Rotaria socialis]